MKPFSVVIPIRNDAGFLKYSLPSIFQLNPDEILYYFDNCTDDSFEVTQHLTQKLYSGKTSYVSVLDVLDWKFRVAFMRRLGFRKARNDLVLTTDADIILDPKITDYLGLIGKDGVAHVGFEVIDYPVNFRCQLKRLLERLRIPVGWLSQVRLFSRKAWLETEDQENLKQMERAEDSHMHEAIRTKYRSRLVLSKCVHLRPIETRERHHLRGRLYWKATKRSFLVALLSGLILFRPSLIVGYLQERLK